jgi:multidrug efflux pump subunit AcrA (membrane-fusion protein)
MKQYYSILILLSTLISCNNKSANEKLKSENAKQDLVIDYIVGVGKIIPENDIIQLSSPVNGIVREIYKHENDTVIIGTVILELEHHLEDAKLLQLRNEVATQSAQINVDNASVDEFVAKCNNAKSELNRLQNLLAKGAETQQTIDNASTDLKSFQANLKRLEANVTVSKSRLNETKAALQVAQVERDQKIITSPVHGRILELTVLIGTSVAIQQSFAQINPEGRTIAICEIDELNAEKVAVGQKGWIRNVGSSDTLSTGTIYFTSSFLKKKSLFTDQSGEKEDRRVMTIKMMLDQPGKLLLNARVECVINLSNNINK